MNYGKEFRKFAMSEKGVSGLNLDYFEKHIEKLNIDSIPIPKTVIDERDRLRTECNQKITNLGITNFSYRNSNLKL